MSDDDPTAGYDHTPTFEAGAGAVPSEPRRVSARRDDNGWWLIFTRSGQFADVARDREHAEDMRRGDWVVVPVVEAVVEEVGPVSEARTPFESDAKHPTWAAYVAANLKQALSLVPDTGDWHAALRSWCEQNIDPGIPPLPLPPHSEAQVEAGARVLWDLRNPHTPWMGSEKLRAGFLDTARAVLSAAREVKSDG